MDWDAMNYEMGTNARNYVSILTEENQILNMVLKYVTDQ